MIEISRILAGLKLGSLTDCESFLGPVLYAMWEKAAGPKIAGVSRLESYKESMLTIGVEDERWLRELEEMRPCIEERFRRLTGREAIRVEFTRILPRPRTPGPPAPPRRCTSSTKGKKSRSSLGEEIPDEELKAAFLKAYEKYQELHGLNDSHDLRNKE